MKYFKFWKSFFSNLKCLNGYCSQRTVHHIRFCPVNLLLISWRALGSLDTNSGGRDVLLAVEPVVRGNGLVFIRRSTDWLGVFVLCLRDKCMAADVWSVASLVLCRVCLVFSVSLLFSRVSLFTLLFSKREYSSIRYSENLFPPISLQCSNTWPHAHEVHESVVDAWKK